MIGPLPFSVVCVALLALIGLVVYLGAGDAS